MVLMMAFTIKKLVLGVTQSFLGDGFDPVSVYVRTWGQPKQFAFTLSRDCHKEIMVLTKGRTTHADYSLQQ